MHVSDHVNLWLPCVCTSCQHATRLLAPPHWPPTPHHPSPPCRQLASGQAGKLSADIGVAASLAVAALAGAGNMLITTPAAVVTTQMQAQHKQRQQQAANSAYTGPPPPTAASVSRQIWQQDGITGFWKGLMPSLILVVNPAVQYMLFEGLMTRALKLRIKQQQRTGAAPAKGTPRLGVGDVFLLGALAKIGATVVTYPMIVVKARLQAINEETDTEMQYSGTWDAICTIVRDEGVPGFFKGMGAKLAQTALNAALMLVVRDKVNEVARATAAKVLRPQVAGGAQQVAVIRR